MNCTNTNNHIRPRNMARLRCPNKLDRLTLATTVKVRSKKTKMLLHVDPNAITINSYKAL